MARKRPELIFNVTEYFGNLVGLPKQTWESHVLNPIEGHPQMAGYENLVQRVIQDPLEIWQGQWITSAVFVSEPLVGPSPDGVRVVVSYDNMAFEKGSAIGSIVTAYPIDRIAYPTPRLRRRIYRKGP